MAAQGGGALIELEEEIEGEVIGTKNYRFCSIGEPVPILNSEFDPQCLPSQPLAVSERFRLLFVAHPHGFCVTRTKDVMKSAEEIKENGSGPSVGELSLVNVDIGKVSILALSVDDSSLAAILESNVHVFAVSALLHKEQRPSYSVSLDDSSCIKDMRWAKKDAKAYVILSENGKLYHGSGQGPPTCVMDNVDSVDWSVGGNSVAVAKRNTLSILSMQFKEKISFVLPFESVAGDSGVNKVIKVDSVRWVRPDCIAVGCFELNEDGDEENYIVQLVTSRGQRITDVDSKPILLSFNSVFIDYCSDAVPARNGPHMFLSYLARFEVAFIANRNLSRSVGLFSWSMNNGKNEASVVEILDDAWSFHINEYQENDEENVLLGLCVDKVAQNEDIKFTLGDEEVEVSPCCVIICVTIDGKISVFHFVSAIGASSTSPEYAVSDEEDDATHISFGACEQSNEQTVSKSDSHTLTSSELGKSDAKATNMNQRPPFQIDLRSEEQAAAKNMGQKPTENFRKLELNGHPENSLSISPIQDRNAEKQSISEVKSSPALFSAKEIGGLSSQSMGNSPLSGHRVEPLGKIRSSKDLPGAGFSTWSNDAMRSSAGRFLSPPPSHPVDSDKRALQSVGVPQKPTDLKDKINPSLASTSFGQTASAAVNRQSMPSYPAQVRLDDRIRSEKSPTGFPYSAQNAPKQFGNVEEMAKKLDTLLEGIQGKGGFVDQCITSQEKVVAGLEDSTQALNEICKTWRGLLDDQSMEVQLLLDKTVQALVRKEYMEGIFKQITDSRYWELWNRQKLSSELELKRRCILDLNQELTNQLIELERHFNALELNKFGESGGTSRNRSVSRNWSGHSRQIQSLNTLHNTMIAQLAAAEHLSGCLSEQMSALSIDSSAKNDAKKQLFESIGLSYVGDSHKSAKDTAFSTPPNKEKSTPSYSVATKEQSRRNQVSNSKNYEADTARRRRDSLDRSWATYEPPKTTVSRMLLKDVEKGSASRSMVKMDRQYLTPQSQNKPEAAQAAIWSASGSSLNSNKSKGTAEATAKPSNESASTSLFQKRSGLLGNGTQGSSSLSFPALSPQSTFKTTTTRNNESEASTPQSIFKTAIFKNSESGASTPPSIFKTALTQNSELGASRLTDEKSKDTIPFTLNSDSVASNKSKLFQQSTSGFNPVQSKSTRLPEQSLTSSSHSTESLSNSKLEFTKSSQEPNKPLDGAPASTTPLQSVFGSLTNSSNTLPSFSSFASKPSSQISFPVSSSSDASVSTKAGFTFPSTLSLSTPQSNLSTPSPSSTISRSESLTQVSDPPITMRGSKTEQNAQTLPSVANVPSTVEKDLKTQASTSQPVLAISKPDLNLGLSAPPTSTEALTGSKSGNRVDLSNSSMPTPIVRPDSKPEQPFATETPSPIAVSSDGNLGSVNNVISDESVEEEMEEEAPETNQTTEFSLGNLGGFGIGSTPNSTTSRQNPFGVSNPNLFGVSTPNPTTSPFQMPSPNGQLFRPASFDFQSPQTSQAQQQTNVNSFSGGFGTGNPGQVSGGSGFVQPAQMGAGAGQQALGSVLGTFGQSRQVGLGGGLPGSGGATPSGFGGGFAGVSGGGGFGGGFSSAATSGGFASLASAGGGGFAAAAAGAGGGFAAAASGGGFAPAAGAGGGFASLSGAPVSGGGFGAFNQQGGGGGGGGGFSAFGGGGGSGGARPPSELFTQMRR